MDQTQARRQMQVRVFRTLEEHDRADAEYWAALPAEERTLQVWKLSEAQWRLQGDWPGESGLCRSIARIHRP